MTALLNASHSSALLRQKLCIASSPMARCNSGLFCESSTASCRVLGSLVSCCESLLDVRVTGSGSEYLFSMPSSPAASIAVNARYGLHAASGALYSTRTLGSCPGLYAGIRMRSFIFPDVQVANIGASNPGTSLL